MFDKIVWATDGSEHADRALGYARQLAKADGASLHVIHIIEKFAGSRAKGQEQHADEPEIDDKIKRQAAQLGRPGWHRHAPAHVQHGRQRGQADRRDLA